MAWTSATKASARAGASAAAMNARNAARAGVEHVGSGTGASTGRSAAADSDIVRTTYRRTEARQLDHGPRSEVAASSRPARHAATTGAPCAASAGIRAELRARSGSSTRSSSRWPHSDDADRGETVASAPELTYAARAASVGPRGALRSRRHRGTRRARWKSVHTRRVNAWSTRRASTAVLQRSLQEGRRRHRAAMRLPASGVQLAALSPRTASVQSWRSATIGSTPAARRAGR